jgi:cyclophilin family peptidyl-prolyl cis-trans isomerase
MTARQPLQLQGYYTSFGKVVGDLSAVDKIEAAPVNERDHPTEDMKIVSIEIK